MNEIAAANWQRGHGSTLIHGVPPRPHEPSCSGQVKTVPAQPKSDVTQEATKENRSRTTWRPGRQAAETTVGQPSISATPVSGIVGTSLACAGKLETEWAVWKWGGGPPLSQCRGRSTDSRRFCLFSCGWPGERRVPAVRQPQTFSPKENRKQMLMRQRSGCTDLASKRESRDQVDLNLRPTHDA